MEKYVHIIPKNEAKNLGMSRFFTGAPCRRGHIAERKTSSGDCIECLKVKRNTDNGREKQRRRMNEWLSHSKGKKASSDRNYRQRNRKRIDKKKKKYVDENKALVAERKNIWYSKNKEHCRIKSKAWVDNNPEKRKEIARKWAEKFRSTPEGRAICCMRSMVVRVAKNRESDARTTEILGYTVDDFRSRIESLFEDGMTWNNHGEWHIDHIKPVSAFIKEGVIDPSIINALDNLQPLWAYENLSKGATYEPV